MSTHRPSARRRFPRRRYRSGPPVGGAAGRRCDYQPQGLPAAGAPGVDAAGALVVIVDIVVTPPAADRFIFGIHRGLLAADGQPPGSRLKTGVRADGHRWARRAGRPHRPETAFSQASTHSRCLDRHEVQQKARPSRSSARETFVALTRPGPPTTHPCPPTAPRVHPAERRATTHARFRRGGFSASGRADGPAVRRHRTTWRHSTRCGMSPTPASR
jgi:hypothetical protein